MKSQAIDNVSSCLFIGLTYHSAISSTCFIGAYCGRQMLTGIVGMFSSCLFCMCVPVPTSVQKCGILKALVI